MSEWVGPMDVGDTEALMWLQIDDTQACCRFGSAPEGDEICCTRGLAGKKRERARARSGYVYVKSIRRKKVDVEWKK